jgi:hypothetical protein
MRGRSRILVVTGVLWAALLVPVIGPAQEGQAGSRTAGTVTISGVTLDRAIEIDGRPCRLVGAGLLRYRTVFKAYVAGLYLGREHGSRDLFRDIPKRLVIEYFHAIEARGFVSSTRQGFRNNLSREQLDAIEKRAGILYSLYRDVRPGDRYSFTYVPGRGSELALNGRVLGTVSGLDFANAFLSIWLGPSPLDQDLKKKLLGPDHG